ncbi:hypothetical protein KCU81_g9960, partial [Aureobasidium melanogenum]|uniref:Uncharacterized protein n=2 Tax=Aureobasidium melanogenum TaxID=46634 RepID=A0A074VBC6_AURM1
METTTTTVISEKANNQIATQGEVTETSPGSVTDYRAKLNFRQNYRRLASYVSSKEGWLGDYDYLYLITPNISPVNRKSRNYAMPFYGLNNKVPIFLTLILGFQYALTMFGSIGRAKVKSTGVMKAGFYRSFEKTDVIILFVVANQMVADQRNRCDETAEPTLSKKAHSPKTTSVRS